MSACSAPMSGGTRCPGCSVPGGIGELLLPEQVHGVQAVLTGLQADEGVLVVWRGPMLHEAVVQFVADVFWGNLDMLVVDVPPGTGDVVVFLVSLLPGVKLLVVTAPHEVAYDVTARRAGGYPRSASPIGVVENLSR